MNYVCQKRLDELLPRMLYEHPFPPNTVRKSTDKTLGGNPKLGNKEFTKYLMGVVHCISANVRYT